MEATDITLAAVSSYTPYPAQNPPEAHTDTGSVGTTPPLPTSESMLDFYA